MPSANTNFATKDRNAFAQRGSFWLLPGQPVPPKEGPGPKCGWHSKCKEGGNCISLFLEDPMANLKEFGASLETTREWIDDLMETLRTDNEPQACRALRITLHELREHMTNEEVADFSAQLPQLLRGVFFEGWRPTGKPVKRRSLTELLERLYEQSPDCENTEQVEVMVRDVFEFLCRHISAGEIRHIVTGLPKELRTLWPADAERLQA